MPSRHYRVRRARRYGPLARVPVVRRPVRVGPCQPAHAPPGLAAVTASFPWTPSIATAAASAGWGAAQCSMVELGRRLPTITPSPLPILGRLDREKWGFCLVQASHVGRSRLHSMPAHNLDARTRPRTRFFGVSSLPKTPEIIFGGPPLGRVCASVLELLTANLDKAADVAVAGKGGEPQKRRTGAIWEFSAVVHRSRREPA